MMYVKAFVIVFDQIILEPQTHYPLLIIILQLIMCA